MNSDAYYAYGERTEHPTEKQELPSSLVERTQRGRRRCVRPIPTAHEELLGFQLRQETAVDWGYSYIATGRMVLILKKNHQDSDVRRWRCLKVTRPRNVRYVCDMLWCVP